MRNKLNSFGALLVLVLLGTSYAVVAPPLCPIEGAGIMGPPLVAEGFTNCQPRPLMGDEFNRANTAIRYPDAVSSNAPVVQNFCSHHLADDYPGMVPGLWFFSAGTCPSDLAAVNTQWVRSRRSVGSDGGCDQPGNLCPVALYTAIRQPFLEEHIWRVRVYHSGRQVWKQVN